MPWLIRWAADTSRSSTFRTKIQDLADKQNLRTLVAFCHGTSDWVQFGVRKSTMSRFSDALARAAVKDDFRVVLYACSTGADLGTHGDDDHLPVLLQGS